MKHCKTCIHWTANWKSRTEVADHGECQKIMPDAIGRPDMKAWLWPGGDRETGGLITKEDFGCVLHEPKREKP